MHEYDLSLPEFILRLRHHLPLFRSPANRALLGAYLPGVELVRQRRYHQVRVTVSEEYPGVTAPCLINRGKEIELVDTRTDEAAMLDLLNLLYGIARGEWLSRGLYPVHSACVADGAGAILLVGHSGAGKTSIALRLAGERGMKIVSGNKTLISLNGESMTAMAGTHTITLRADDAASNAATAGNAAGYEHRAAATLGDELYVNEPTLVRAIVMPRLNDGARICEKLSPESALHRLYPFFLDYVHSDVILFGGKAAYWPQLRYQQLPLLMRLPPALTEMPVYSMAGSMDFVVESMGRL